MVYALGCMQGLYRPRVREVGRISKPRDALEWSDEENLDEVKWCWVHERIWCPEINKGPLASILQIG